MADVSDVFIERYKNLAGVAAEFELRIRLIAGVTKELEKFQYEELSILEPQLFAHFSALISPEEQDFLTKTRTLRNKIMHGDFKSLMTKLSSMGVNAKGGGSVVANLTTGLVKATVETTKKESGIFGWLLEASTGNVFQNAVEIFSQAKAIYMRVAFEQATKDLGPKEIQHLEHLGVISRD